MRLQTPLSVFILFSLASAAAEFLNTTGSSPLCPGSKIVEPASDWTWARDVNPKWSSCSDPKVVNNGKMCEGDPTSIVMQANGDPQCLAATMKECKFNMHAVKRINFDVVIWNCVGTWSAPLWLNPSYWFGGASSGEIDLVEMCPMDKVRTNFAAGGYPKIWPVDGNFANVHVTMWNTNGDITVKMCEKPSNGLDECDGEGAAFYPAVYDSSACAKGKDCTYEFVADIWNGKAGDGGWQYCAQKKYNAKSICSFAVSNIRVDAEPGTFKGKCEALTKGSPSPGPGPSPGPSPPPPPPPPAPQGHCSVGDWVQCADGYYNCAGNQCCGDGSICPSADPSYHKCPYPKHNDCLDATCYTGDRVICPGNNPKEIHCAGEQCCPDGSVCPSSVNGFHNCPKPKHYNCKAQPGAANVTNERPLVI